MPDTSQRRLLPDGLDFFWIPLAPSTDDVNEDACWEPRMPDPTQFLKLAFSEKFVLVGHLPLIPKIARSGATKLTLAKTRGLVTQLLIAVYFS